MDTRCQIMCQNLTHSKLGKGFQCWWIKFTLHTAVLCSNELEPLIYFKTLPVLNKVINVLSVSRILLFTSSLKTRSKFEIDFQDQKSHESIYLANFSFKSVLKCTRTG